MFFSITIVVLVFISIVINLLAAPDDIVEEVGVKTFRMFTVLSNLLIGIATAMTIPFAVDGIRQKNYHLPRWIVNLTFMGTNCVSLTFLISSTALSASVGFVRIMLDGSNLFLHTISPILAIVSFLFVNAYHTVKFKTVFVAIAPVFVYAMVYLVSAILIGEENGGWRDHYHFEDIMPWYFVLPVMLLLTFGIACLLRGVHNAMHRRDKLATERYYQATAEYDFPNIEEAIRKMATDNKAYDVGGEVTVPRRLIKMLEERYKSNKPLSYLCGVYLEEYLK